MFYLPGYEQAWTPFDKNKIEKNMFFLNLFS